MSTSEAERLSDVWREVRQWPPPARLSLASKILQSLEAENAHPSGTEPGELRALSDLIGAWKAGEPSDDEAIERILDEERMRRHG